MMSCCTSQVTSEYACRIYGRVQISLRCVMLSLHLQSESKKTHIRVVTNSDLGRSVGVYLALVVAALPGPVDDALPVMTTISSHE